MGLALGLAGCSTPGPAHLYLYAEATGVGTVRDVDPLSGDEIARIPSFVEQGEQVIGLAYDPFTDHLFLRIFPGNFIRVVDRPAKEVKRTFSVPRLPLGGHDLAIRSRDRHLFFSDPTGPALIETTLYGKFVRHIPLEGLTAPVRGVAHDARADELLVLAESIGDQLRRYSTDGRLVSELRLARLVQGYSLAYDSVAQTFFASLADSSAIAVFDAEGRLLRILARPAAERGVMLDIGPRSLLRLF